MVILFARIGRLDLSLVCTHPDRVGGLGFLQKLPSAFALVTFALSAFVASKWAHSILYHETPIMSFKMPLAAFTGILTLLLLLPLLTLAPLLHATKKKALPAYAALVGEHGRLVHRRWILGEPVTDAALLEAPELGPIADTADIYSSVAAMRPAPIGVPTIMAILIPLAIPMLLVLSFKVPIKDILLKLLKTLV